MPEAKQRARGVVAAVSRGVVRVVVGDEREMLASRSGRMRVHRVFVVVGDEVEVEHDACDASRGRIVRRLTPVGPPRMSER